MVLNFVKTCNFKSIAPALQNYKYRQKFVAIMHPFSVMSVSFISKLKLFHSITPICTQVRWKKIPIRKPKWLPMAKSKMFRIPEHPFVSAEEQDLRDELLEDYYRKVESLRKLIREEIKNDPNNKEHILEEQQKKEEENFRLLLEENKKENERIAAIREEVMEKELQEKHLMWLEMAEETKRDIELRKQEADRLVRIEKEKSKAYISLENLDAAIEQAIDNPINLNFSLNLNGSIKWEGLPPKEYEADIQKRISESMQFK